MMQISNQSYGVCASFYRLATSAVCFFFYKIASVVSGCIGKNSSREYALLSNFYFERMAVGEAYLLFDDDLIAPVVNMERTKNLSQPLNLGKIDALFNSVMQKKPPSISFNRSEYPQEKITTGLCFSLALNFISKYLRAVRDGQDVRATVCTLAKKFKEGASERTGIIQGISLTACNGSQLDLFQAVANLYDVKLSNTPTCCEFTTWKNAQSFLSAQLDALEDGIYFVSQQHQNPSELWHCVTYLKHQNHRVLFDPQLGTIQCVQNKDAEYLLKSLKYANGNRLVFFNSTL
jgi:hypothetical protein